MAEAPVMPGDAFTIRIAPQSTLTRAAAAAARPFLSPLFGLQRLRRLYEEAAAQPGLTFECRVLQALQIRIHVDARDRAGIPAAGALIVAANHPTGALDGLVAVETIRQVRTDVRIVTNHLLARIPELHDSCFFVDPFGGTAAAARSRAGLRGAHLWLRQGGALVLFPAGEVAWQLHHEPAAFEDDSGVTAWMRRRFRKANAASSGARRRDSGWNDTVGRLARATGATVLPMFIDAGNSPSFYRLGRLHPMLRTAQLGRELLNKRGASVRVVVGPMRPIESLPGSAAEVTASIRRTVDALAGSTLVDPPTGAAAIAPPTDAALLEQDVRALPAEAHLLASASYDVFCARSVAIPHVLREIGRLRELTFRTVGEGTGRASDLDRFDDHYDHLFVWNRTAREVVGAYRLGATDRLLSSHGVDGLYTRTLFRYDERMLTRLGPALELGRSFVRPEYQRSYSALLLLWKGIGQFVVRSPRYRVLFGCVSISGRYQETSQQLLRAFLAQERLDTALAGLVEPLNPPSPIAPPAREAVACADVETLERLITRIEGSHGIPVLLRQYLKLNATLLGFNVDPAFGDALDALMMVDLARLPPATLQRYLGRTAAHRITSDRAAA